MTELLSPAGSKEALVAAVQSGADAVYLGVDNFNARRGARNFSLEDLRAAVAYCHLRGVRVYLTLNTLLHDRELHLLASTARVAGECGVDAILVQDWGVLDILRGVAPEVPLHASTQMSVHTLSGAEEAARAGLSRVVLARELSRHEIEEICRRSPIEVEVFVHGALCVCYSGQCAMSAVIGQRSGNRGLCAQPCRLPYNGGHPLSLRDNNLAAYVPELMDMGVACLKLEGRMKRPEYVAAVTSIYACLLREHRAATEEEQRLLEAAFSRGGFTDGYYTGRRGAEMFGVRPSNAHWPEEWFAQLRAVYERGDGRLIPVRFAARLPLGEPMTLLAGDSDDHVVTVSGPAPEAARTRSVTEDEARQRLCRTGGTPFRVEQCVVKADEGISVTAASLNALRRDALAALEARRTEVPQRRYGSYQAPARCENRLAPPELTVSLQRSEQFSPALAEARPAWIYMPIEELRKTGFQSFLDHTAFCAVLPRVYRTGDEGVLRAWLADLAARGVQAAGIGNLGHFALVRDCELEKHGELSLNVMNSASLRFLQRQGLHTAALSFELRREQLRDLQKCLPCEAVIYGRLPLMLLENRPAAGGENAERELTLKDRRGERFPVTEVYGGRWELENSKTLYLADREHWQELGLAYARLRFTTESAEVCAAILRAHQEGRDCEPEGMTRGLFYRGVE